MHRLSIALIVVATLAQLDRAEANGRPPSVVSIAFRNGHEQDIAAGITFGMLLSHDAGASWQWVCEDALHYAGIFDPDLEFTEAGALFATTIESPEVARDGCTFEPTGLGTKVVSSIAQGPTGDVLLAAGDTDDSKIYRSSDGGMTFPVSAMPAVAGTWWNSIAVAPGDAMRVYASGYRFEGTRVLELHRSDDGGATFAPMSLTNVVTSPNSEIYLVGISKQDPDKLYMRVTFPTVNIPSEAIYKSPDGGTTWTKIREETGAVSFVLRANGDLVVATSKVALVSRAPSDGATWEPLATPPHIACLTESSAGGVWACTDNYADGGAIMKSADLTTWSTVLKFENIQGPVECPAGTIQHDQCVFTSPPPRAWCALREQLGIVADPTDPSCPAPEMPRTDGGGCCESSGTDVSTNVVCVVMVVGLALRRRRRSSRLALRIE